uniref:PPPDE domain-containing protein n=1 Tax=Compsopogon caeruleus TaxID=31354 RepID=A0A7S1T804_9RHOD|mmetsp:Transcript_12207/g.24911  ORF Transcript_12207/g.24911 Transcript_12207/m.24911 type:complete len:142 (+) Transcript_12207:228-653(+)
MELERTIRTPVHLNVYELSLEPEEGLMGKVVWLVEGLGVYHSGVEVYGMEYAFGGHQEDSTGVFTVEPRQAPDAKFRESISVGTTDRTPEEVTHLIELLSEEYKGPSYNLLDRYVQVAEMGDRASRLVSLMDIYVFCRRFS